MAQRRHDTSETPPEDDGEEGPAPADLLQMWINGSHESPSETVGPEPVGPTPEPDGAETTPAVETPAAEPPTAPQSWWPADNKNESPADPAADPSRWWPYAAGHAEGADTSPEDDAEEPPVAEHAALPSPVRDHEDDDTYRARGWASFGAAPTAEDLLEGMDLHGYWSDRVTGGRPVVTPSVSSVVPTTAGEIAAVRTEPESTEPDADTAASRASAEDVSPTAHWTLDDFEEYTRSQSGNELSEWLGADLPQDAVAEVETELAGAQDTDVPAATDDAQEEKDHKEWYDGSGLCWTSEDGGYTWFSTDGQGWNAEIGEPIEVPSPSPSAAAGVPTPGVDAPAADPDLVQQSDAEGLVDPGAPTTLPATTRPAAVSAEAGTSDAEVPEHVVYKPRGAYRPLLAVLFVLAAVSAVAAIIWAFSKGSQAATGIAAGVTGFALAFLWGLLSWTPTVVTVNGSILEVARGSDGELFDLSSPDLDIDLDDDTASRSWRATITRPNGTELVIPASAVDTKAFSTIVRHYRDVAAKSSETGNGR